MCVATLLTATLAVAVAAPGLGPAPTAEAATAPAARPDRAGLAGGDACRLVEGLPAPNDPVRQAPSVRAAFRALDRAGDEPAALRRAGAALERSVATVLDEARRVFHPRGGALDKGQARRFLERHVLGRRPVLRITDTHFRPLGAIQSALVFATCRGGDRATALAQARRSDEAGLRAFAALLLLEAGREDEARELLGGGPSGTFLEAWIRAELAPGIDQRRVEHAAAARRASTPAQRAAVDTQAARRERAP